MAPEKKKTVFIVRELRNLTLATDLMLELIIVYKSQKLLREITGWPLSDRDEDFEYYGS